MIDENVDALVICALELEFNAIKDALDEIAPSVRCEAIGKRSYHIRTISGAQYGTQLCVAVTCVEAMGRVPAAIAARDAVYHFARLPPYVILNGIAAADPKSGYQLGDVVIPQLIIDYAEQKHSRGERTLRARQFNLRGRLHSAAVEFSKSDWFDAVPELTRRYVSELHVSLRFPCRAHEKLGLACGDYVLDDETLVREILDKLSENLDVRIAAVEMESTAIARAIEIVHGPKPEFIVLKAVSDFAYEKRDSAQPFARHTAAYFLAGFLRYLATSNFVADRESSAEAAAVVELEPSAVMRSMLEAYPFDVAAKWRRTAIDGAFEVFRCPRPGNAYGGFFNSEIVCDTRARDWPETFGGLTAAQRDTLLIGLTGSEELGIGGWLKDDMRAPRPIRVLAAPPFPPSLASSSLHLRFGNSDYWTVRAITEISRLERNGGKVRLSAIFPDRWPASHAPDAPPDGFTTQCVPYHVSVQAVIVCEPAPGARYVMLANVNPGRGAITGGWGATMAAQMWGQDRAGNVEPWWSGLMTDKLVPRGQQEGDAHLEQTLYRGLVGEFNIDIRSDLRYEPRLLLAAVEQDMYFMTFIYVVRVPFSVEEVYRRWDLSPEHHHNGLLAAYQLTGRAADGSELDGPARTAELLAQDRFDAGPHLRPEPRARGEVVGPWHVSSRLRLYALGMHFWPYEFSRLVRVR